MDGICDLPALSSLTLQHLPQLFLNRRLNIVVPARDAIRARNRRLATRLLSLKSHERSAGALDKSIHQIRSLVQRAPARLRGVAEQVYEVVGFELARSLNLNHIGAVDLHIAILAGTDDDEALLLERADARERVRDVLGREHAGAGLFGHDGRHALVV